MQHNIVIVDDEIAAREAIKQEIAQFDQLSVVGEFADGESAFEFIRKSPPVLIFLDIELPKINGLTLAKQLDPFNCQIVFITGDPNHALAAFDTRAIDFLVKPIHPERIAMSLEKLLFQHNHAQPQSNNNTIVVADGYTQYRLAVEHIAYIETLDRYCCLYLCAEGLALYGQKTIISSLSLERFETQLDNQLFLRIHRNCLINTNKITKLSSANGSYHAHLTDPPIALTVARRKVSLLKKQLATH